MTRQQDHLRYAGPAGRPTAGGRCSYDASRRQGGEERGHTFVVSDLIYTSQPEDIDLHCDTEPL